MKTMIITKNMNNQNMESQNDDFSPSARVNTDKSYPNEPQDFLRLTMNDIDSRKYDI